MKLYYFWQSFGSKILYMETSELAIFGSKKDGLNWATLAKHLKHLHWKKTKGRAWEGSRIFIALG